MSDSEVTKLNVAVTRLGRLAVLQSSAIMQLSAAILSMDNLDEKARAEVMEVFTGLQDHIDVLSELSALGVDDGQ
ncbi:hypothetical protein JIQ88_05475 [Pseudomonas sp. PCH44]|uniref:hypothetical protein n=1 Tax=Pseudomonas sp. PCH44 TaxID=2800904 RepID=UPI001BAE6272|nr:hypothetical protein [Pseudomonas sp. PCH44]MBS3184514.1 hypothetical protein [Pseudomonas sp. PCH44]